MLLDSGLTDGILIEGSNGRIDFSPILSGLAKNSWDTQKLTNSELNEYWRAELDWGHIAAYEFIGLTRPNVIVHGVEDMVAKARFAIKGLAPNKGELHRQREADQRSMDLFDNAVQDISAKVDSNKRKRIDGLLGSYRDTVSRSQAAHAEYVTAGTPSKERLDLEAERVNIAEEWRKLNPTLLDAQRTEGEYKQKVAAYNEKLKPYHADITNFKGLVAKAKTGDLAARRRVEKITEIAEELQPEKKELDALAGELKNFDERYGPIFTGLNADAKRIATRISELEKPRGQALQAFAKVLEAKRAAYFRLANALRDGGVKVDKIESFFRDEALLTREERKNEFVDMNARDAAMVENTIKFFDERRDIRRVILIVGSFHLEGMTARLREAGFDVLAGKMTAADSELEPWEEDEYNRRDDRVSTFFADIKMNPEAHFLNPDWTREQVQSIHAFRTLETRNSKFINVDEGLAWNGKVFATEDGKKGVALINQSVNPEAHIGSHVARRGPVPGEPGQHYELFDREFATMLAKELSKGGKTAFTYFHKEKVNGRNTYALHTPDGKMTLDQFENAPPRTGGARQRVVMFGEPDTVMEGTVAMSPLWKRLRSGAGGGKDGGPPKPPKWTGAWDDGPNGPERSSGGKGRGGKARNQPSLLLTVHPTRAKRNVEAIEKQPAKGPIAHIDYEADPGEFEDAHFTVDGEHAQMVVILAKNTAEFRATVERAGKAGKLEGKQIALLTCGDAFVETDMLKEKLLDNGALMVWVPDRKITPDGARSLAKWIQHTAGLVPPAVARGDISEVVFNALDAWQQSDDDKTFLHDFRFAKPWVILWPASVPMLGGLEERTRNGPVQRRIANAVRPPGCTFLPTDTTIASAHYALA